MPPCAAQNRRFLSQVLGLELWLDGKRLRFSVGDAAVPYADELIERMTRLSAEAHQRVEQLETELASEQRLREDEQRLREDEQQRRKLAEAEIARLKEELERLRGSSD